MRTAYLNGVAVGAAAALSERLRPMARFVRRVRRAIAASNSFPNDEGNYRGKRRSRPSPEPLTPAERFYGLTAAYHAAAAKHRRK